MSNKFKTDHLAGELRRFRRGVELQRAAERLAWRAPFPPRPEPIIRKALEIKESNVEGVDSDDTLILRATIANAMRKGNVP